VFVVAPPNFFYYILLKGQHHEMVVKMNPYSSSLGLN
jgi:hypothetical protein